MKSRRSGDGSSDRQNPGSDQKGQRKRTRRSQASEAPSEVATSSDVDELIKWLHSNGCRGLDDLEFRMTPDSGLGCFAKRDFDVGDVMFTVPQRCIITFAKAVESTAIKAIISEAFSEEQQLYCKEITAELLVWIFMCGQLNNDKSSFFSPYLRALASDANLPTVCCWPENLQRALVGTNLSANTAAVKPRIAAQCEAVQSLPSSTSACITEGSLLWARSHYLSRRYPAHFGDDESDTTNHLLQALPREAGLSNMGSLVPLLDVLNHKSEVEWLKFKVQDKSLHVICNYPRQKVS
jgi:hypothetical protein